MHDAIVVATRPAGFWIRGIAALIDVLLILVVQLTFVLLGRRLWGGGSLGDSTVFAGIVGFFTILFAAVYAIVLHAGPGQTIGKLVVGARVVDVDGAPAGLGPALLRWLAYFASGATFGIGFLIAGLRRDKRALHDLIAGTRVERLPRRRGIAPPLLVPRGEPAPPVAPTGV